MLTIGANKKMILKKRLYIYYLMKLQENKETIQTLIDLDNKVNAITPSYVAALGLKVHFTYIMASKIHNFFLPRYGIVVPSFKI